MSHLLSLLIAVAIRYCLSHSHSHSHCLAFYFVLILLINILIKIVFIARKVISHEKLAQEKDNEVGTHELGPAASSVNPSAVGTTAPPAAATTSGTAAVEASSSRRNERTESDVHSVNPQHLQALKGSELGSVAVCDGIFQK